MSREIKKGLARQFSLGVLYQILAVARVIQKAHGSWACRMAPSMAGRWCLLGGSSAEAVDKSNSV